MKHIKILTLAALACSLGAAALELPEQLRDHAVLQQQADAIRTEVYRLKDNMTCTK